MRSKYDACIAQILCMDLQVIFNIIYVCMYWVYYV